jgi:hypothetical protein
MINHRVTPLLFFALICFAVSFNVNAVSDRRKPMGKTKPPTRKAQTLKIGWGAAKIGISLGLLAGGLLSMKFMAVDKTFLGLQELEQSTLFNVTGGVFVASVFLATLVLAKQGIVEIYQSFQPEPDWEVPPGSLE